MLKQKIISPKKRGTLQEPLKLMEPLLKSIGLDMKDICGSFCCKKSSSSRKVNDICHSATGAFERITFMNVNPY